MKTKEFVLTPAAQIILQGWLDRTDVDDSLIEADIELIGKVQDFILEHWGVNFMNIDDSEIKCILINLHCVKRILKELVEGVYKQK